MARVGGNGDRKGINVVIRDLEWGCSEISSRTASSKDEVKRIACLVNWRGLGKGEVKRGKEGNREIWKCQEVEVSKYEEW